VLRIYIELYIFLHLSFAIYKNLHFDTLHTSGVVNMLLAAACDSYVIMKSHKITCITINGL